LNINVILAFVIAIEIIFEITINTSIYEKEKVMKTKSNSISRDDDNEDKVIDSLNIDDQIVGLNQTKTTAFEVKNIACLVVAAHTRNTVIYIKK